MSEFDTNGVLPPLQTDMDVTPAFGLEQVTQPHSSADPAGADIPATAVDEGPLSMADVGDAPTLLPEAAKPEFQMTQEEMLATTTDVFGDLYSEGSSQCEGITVPPGADKSKTGFFATSQSSGDGVNVFGASAEGLALENSIKLSHGEYSVGRVNLDETPVHYFELFANDVQWKGAAQILEIGGKRYAIAEKFVGGQRRLAVYSEGHYALEKTPSQWLDDPGFHTIDLDDGGVIEINWAEYASEDFPPSVDIRYVSGAKRFADMVMGRHGPMNVSEIPLKDGVAETIVFFANEEIDFGAAQILDIAGKKYAVIERVASGRREIGVQSQFRGVKNIWLEPGENIFDTRDGGLVAFDWTEHAGENPYGMVETTYISNENKMAFFEARAAKGQGFYKVGIDRGKYLRIDVGEKVIIHKKGVGAIDIVFGNKAWSIKTLNGIVDENPMESWKGQDWISDIDGFNASTSDHPFVVTPERDAYLLSGPKGPGILSGIGINVGIGLAGFGLIKLYESQIGRKATGWETLAGYMAPATAVLGAAYGFGVKGAINNGVAPLKAMKAVATSNVKSGAVGMLAGLPVGIGVAGGGMLLGLHPESDAFEIFAVGSTGVLAELAMHAPVAGVTATEALAAGSLGVAAKTALIGGLEVTGSFLGGLLAGRVLDHALGQPLQVIDPTSDGTLSDAFAKDPWLWAPVASWALLGGNPIPGALVYGGHKIYDWATDEEQRDKDVKNIKGAPAQAKKLWKERADFVSSPALDTGDEIGASLGEAIYNVVKGEQPIDEALKETAGEIAEAIGEGIKGAAEVISSPFKKEVNWWKEAWVLTKPDEVEEG